MNMKNIYAAILTAMIAVPVSAQKANQPFSGIFVNKEYNVNLTIDFHGKGINVPGHEILGELPGYLSKRHNSFYWLITSAKLKGKQKAEIELINDYGSEDLTATLAIKNDSTIILTQQEGSALKVPNNGKWQKLPDKLEFKKQ